MSKLDVPEEMVIERRVGELEDGFGDIVSRGFDWDIVILLEVDTSLLLGWVVGYTEELTLDAGVCWTCDMLAVLPCAITAAASGSNAATST